MTRLTLVPKVDGEKSSSALVEAWNQGERNLRLAIAVARANKGKKKMESKNKIAVVNAVKPVLPPAETPAPDSTKVVTVEVPSIAPAAVAIESDSMILL